MASQPLAIDVETVGLPWEGLMPAIQDYLLERARDDEDGRRFRSNWRSIPVPRRSLPSACGCPASSAAGCW